MIFWTKQPKYSKSDDFARVCAIINPDLFWCEKMPKTNKWMTLALTFNHIFEKISFWSIFCFLYQLFVNSWRQKNPNSKMVHPRKISTPEVRGKERFFYSKIFFHFWFRPLFGKMIAAPPRTKQLWKNLGLWSTQ